MVEARRKVRVLAEDLGIASTSAAALAVVTSELAREAVGRSGAYVDLSVEEQESLAEVVVTIEGATDAADLRSLRSRYEITASRTKGARPESAVRLAIPLPTDRLVLSDEFVDFERERLIKRSPSELLAEVRRQNVELTGLLQELRATKEDLVRKTRELEAVNRELEAFSYSVSHDLRAPLRAIDGFSQAVLEDYEDRLDDEGRGYLQRIRAATRRMAQLIDDLLGLSRLTRNEMLPAEVDLSELAQDVAAEMSEKSGDREIEWSIEPGMVAVADPALMRVVFTNLIGNAVKFTEGRERARIEVFTEDSGDDAPWFAVRDNGAGFDMKYADKLFGAFQRLHTESEFEGTGIGLATVQRAVRRHGGDVRAEGEVGVGATFAFRLPPQKGGE